MAFSSIIMLPLLLLFLAIWAGLIYLLILLIRALRKYLRGGEARRGGAVQRADAVLLIHTLAGTGNQTHTHHPISMDLGLALPKAAVFMSGPEMRRAFRRVPPALRLRSGREIFKRPVREGGFAGR